MGDETRCVMVGLLPAYVLAVLVFQMRGGA